MTDHDSGGEINVRSMGYWIALAAAACPHCCSQTRLMALAVPPLHETLSDPGEAGDGEAREDTWEVAGCNAFLFYVEYLPQTVRRRLEHFSSGYRPAYSAAALASYWVNHCERCGALIDDHELFCEPAGAFLPTGPASASAIALVRVEEALEAAAGGYAIEPEFFDAMVQA
jgi:hypothetical protein